MGHTATRLGDVLNDTYELLELVSSDRQLEVYLAKDTRTSGDVRVTLLRPEFALQPRVVEGLFGGPRRLSAVSHASLPSVHVDTDDTGIPFIVEEAIEGRTLAALIGSFPQGLPIGMVQLLSLPLVEAIALAHEHGLVHGRIDATHVKLIGPAHAPAPKWLGLGTLDAERTPNDPNYQAPELSDARDVRLTPRADVFAIGVLLYVMLSGELPFRSGKQSTVPLDEVAPNLPRAWVELTNACLQRSSNARPADARAVLERLRKCLASNDNAASSAEPQPSARRAHVESAQPRAVEPAQARALKPEATVERKPRAKRGEAAVPVTPAAGSGGSTPATRLAKPVGSPDSKGPARHASPETVPDTQPPRTYASGKPEGPPVSDRAGARRSPPPSAAGADSKPPKDKKAAAHDAVQKLNAKHNPNKRARDRNDLPESSMPAPPVSQPAAVRSVPVTTAAPVGLADAEAHPPLETFEVKRPQRARPGQAAPVALTATQLDALRVMRRRDDEDEDRDRWFALFFILVFLALIQFGIPFLGEPDWASARTMLGPKLRIVASAFSLVAFAGVVHVWIARIGDKSLVQRITAAVGFVCAACIFLITTTLYSQSFALGAAAGLARRALPWSAGLFFFLLALRLAGRGLRELSANLAYGTLALLIALGSLYGAYKAVAGSTLGTHGLAHFFKRREPPDAADDPARELLDPTHAMPGQKQQATGDATQGRSEIGANEEDDLRPAEELQGARRKSQHELQNLNPASPQPQ